MKLNKISRHLQLEVENYSGLLWKVERGAQTPKMFELLPRVLQQNVKWSAYGKHLSQVSCQKRYIAYVSMHK